MRRILLFHFWHIVQGAVVHLSYYKRDINSRCAKNSIKVIPCTLDFKGLAGCSTVILISNNIPSTGLYPTDAFWISIRDSVHNRHISCVFIWFNVTAILGQECIVKMTSFSVWSDGWKFMLLVLNGSHACTFKNIALSLRLISTPSWIIMNGDEQNLF
jgi:hypothetical protein